MQASDIQNHPKKRGETNKKSIFRLGSIKGAWGDRREGKN